MSRGRVFGKFRLLASLGAGGMGEVFLAMTRGGLGVRKLNVIKRLRHFAEEDQREQAQQMFLNEAKLATLLNHPNVVQTYDVGIEDGRMYLVMEYLEGQSLNMLLRHLGPEDKRVDDRIVIKMISDALCGLHYAHELCDYDGKPLRIVHRDLSPHNIIVTYEGVAKIVDFGIAKTTVSTKTELGVIKGKFAYMAPEQAGDDRVDSRADVFVMGIVLWELLTGQRLVARRNDLQTINRLMNEEFEPLTSVRPDIDPMLNAIVAKAVQKKPAERYQSALEMREALENCLTTRFRPVRQEEVGKCMTELFKEDRAAIQQRIHDCVAAALEDPDPDQLPLLRGPLEPTPSTRRNEATGSASHKYHVSPIVGTGPTPSLTSPTLTTRRRSFRKVAMIATVATLAVVGAILGLRDRSVGSPSESAAARPRSGTMTNTGTAAAEPRTATPVTAVPEPRPAPVTAEAPVAQPVAQPQPEPQVEASPVADTRAQARERHTGKRRSRDEPARTVPAKPEQAAPRQRVFNTEL